MSDRPVSDRPASDKRRETVPWATGLTVAGFVAAVTAIAVVVLSLGLIRVHPLLAVGLNIVAAGGLAPTLWGWRRKPVWRWFVDVYKRQVLCGLLAWATDRVWLANLVVRQY